MHVCHVVGLRLLVVLVVAFQLKLLSFQEVAGVVFIRDGQRRDVELFEALNQTAFTAHSEHFEQGFLRAVVRVFGASFALCNPNVLVLFIDGKVHVAAHEFRALQHLADAGVAAHDKRFVELHHCLNPRTDEEVVADGDFNGGWETVVNEHHVEQGGVEHDVAVIGYEGIVGRFARKRVGVEVAAVAFLCQDFLHNGVDEFLLKVERVGAGVQLGFNGFDGYTVEDMRQDGKKSGSESS